MPRHKTSVLYMRKKIRLAMNRIWEYPLTVVEAPMGYGKTTAVKEYLTDKKTNVFWQTLDTDSASGFWNGFCCLFRTTDPDFTESLTELGVPLNSIFMETALELFENVDFPDRSVIVLDDYHLLSSTIIDHFIELLVKNIPPKLHIIIISRARFGENTTEMALKGYCQVIAKSDFEFTQDEIVEYYKLCGIILKPNEAAELYVYTEGWISALYLSMLSFLREGRVEQQASLQELIEKVVYMQCTTEVQEFLLTLCVFDSFTLMQAKAMWRKGNIGAIISYLMAKNAFIKFDDFNKTYRIHNIFTSYLREILNRQGEEKRRNVFRLAASWHVSIGDYLNAMDFYEAVGDFEELFATMELDNANSINSERKEKLKGYFKDCPKKIKRKHPIAGLNFARKMFSFNERELYTAQCKEVGEYIEEVLDEKKRNQLLGELELIKSFSKYNDIVGMAEHQQKAYELLAGPSRLFDSKSFWTFGSPSVLYMFYRKSGRLEHEVNVLLEFMPLYCQITSGHGAGAEYVMQAEWYYYQGDFENAGIIIHKALAAAKSHRQIAIILCVLFLQIRLALVNGTLHEALTTLQHMRVEIEEYRQYQVVHTVDICEGFVYSYLNQESKIPAWIALGNLQESRLHFPSHAFFNIAYGKVLLLGGHYRQLLDIAKQFFGIADVFPNLLGRVYTHVYVAAAQYQLKNLAEAQDSLKQALAIAAPDRLIMPFVENGEQIIELLKILEIEGQYPEFIKNIRKDYAQFADNLGVMRAEEQSRNRFATLSDREIEIAGFVAAGLSNMVIADKLHVETITIKKTLQNIFAKLGISSRTMLAKIMIERKSE